MFCARHPPPPQGFIQDFELGKGGNKMVAACESTLTHVSVRAPSLGKFRSSQIVSNAIWDRIVNSYDNTIITILNFMISL